MQENQVADFYLPYNLTDAISFLVCLIFFVVDTLIIGDSQ